MTKLVMCAVRDAALNAYMQPFFSPSTGGATRAFVDAVKSDDSPMFKHPEDYELFHLGDYDDETAIVNANPVPVALMTASRAKDM